ncbi:MAG: MFS transporter [Sulfurifustaceae bacterium]
MDVQSSAGQYRWIIFLILVAGYIAVFFQRVAPATVAVEMMRDLRTREGMMGLLSAVYFYPHAAMQIPAGVLSDRLGAKRTIGVFLMIASLGSVIFGLSHSAYAALAGRFLVGVGMAVLFVPALKIFSSWFEGKEFAVVTGLFVSAGGLGSLLASTPFAALAEHTGWRWSFTVAGIVTFLIALVTLIGVYDAPQRLSMSKSETSNRTARRDRNKVTADILFILKQRSFWPLALWFFCGNGLFFTFAGLWGGPYLERTYALSKTSVGNLLAMIAVGIMIGGALLSAIANRVFGARKTVLALSALAISVLLLVLIAFTDSLPISALYAIYLMFGIFGNGAVAIGFTITKETFPVRVAGTALGLVNLFGFLGPALLQPMIGFLLEQMGTGAGGAGRSDYQIVFISLLLFSGLCLLASVLIKERAVEDPLASKVMTAA